MDKPIIRIDFDGPIHSYEKGWHDGSIYGQVVSGFFDWAAVVQEHFKLVVCSHRTRTYDGRMALEKWFIQEILRWKDSNPEILSLNRQLHFADFEFARGEQLEYVVQSEQAIKFRGFWYDPQLSLRALTDFISIYASDEPAVVSIIGEPEPNSALSQPARGSDNQRASLTFAKLLEVSARRDSRWMKDANWTISDYAVAMMGEGGEACNAIKKLNRIRSKVPNINIEPGRQLSDEAAAVAAIGPELAGTLIYLGLLAAHVGIDLEDAVVREFDRVSELYGFPERLGQ